MIDVVFTAAFAALLVATLIVVRSPATMALLTAAGVGISGVTLQFAAEIGFQATKPRLQWWLLATLVLTLVAGFVQRRRHAIAPRQWATTVVLGSSAVIAIAFLTSRLLAPGAPGPLSAVGSLVSRTSAEDNAKWLSAAAALASGAPVESWANVGGPLLLLLTLAASMLSAASSLLYGGVNEVAVSAGSPILASMLLVVLAPFALSPLVEARFRTQTGRRGATVPWPILLLGMAIVATGVTLLLNYGHLTLQFTILVLTLWVATFLAWRRRERALLLSTVAVICTAEVWFPLNLIALGLLLALIVLGIVAIAKKHRVRDASLLVAGSAALLVLMWEFLRSSIVFSLGIGGGSVSNVTASGSGAGRGVAAVAVPSLPLFSQPGGTEIVTALFATLTVVSVIGALLVLRDTGGRRYALRFAPIAILAAYALLVTLADFWAVGKGPGYASNKLTYAVAVPTLAATLPVALLALDKGGKRMTALRWFALAGVVMLLVIDTFLPRAVIQLKPALWPSASGDPQPYWWPAEVRATAEQPLSSNPIGCVYLPQGADKPSVLPDGPLAYSCTRLLTGIAGQDVAASVVVDWTLSEWLNNESLWDSYTTYFAQLPQETRQRRLILLDADNKVVGIETLQTLMDRYPADPAATS